MKNKFYISAIYTSPPTSMGGNTKIMLELIDNLIEKYDFIVFTTEHLTFKNNLKNYSKIKVISINYPFKKFAYSNHLQEIRYIESIYENYFKRNKIYKNDFFLTPSDFGPDVIPVYNLRKKYEFIWIASLFLFIPSPIENVRNYYGFPFIKYAVYYLYQKYIFSKILKNGDLFLITNDYDRKFFPAKFKKRILAIYGGVNSEQIDRAKKEWKGEKKYDAVYCSRLHPQKGISGILDIWKIVLEKRPESKLAIIGNGEEKYEKFLKQKAKNLAIDKNIKWFGYVNGVDKFIIYFESKIFLHGTIYDNNGMVAAEAQCSGLPVIMYDQPQLKSIYAEGCLKIKISDKNMYSKKILDFLNNPSSKKYKINKKNHENLINFWKWENRIKKLEVFLQN